MACTNTSTHSAAKNPTLHGSTALNKADSFSLVASAAMANDCGDIILPTTPPMVLDARNRSGEVEDSAALALAASCCRLANSAFADVSEPVTAVPTHPSTGESNANKDPLPARNWPMAIVCPEKFIT